MDKIKKNARKERKHCYGCLTLYATVSQPVARRPLVGRRTLLVCRQAFLILLKIMLLDKDFIKIIKSLPYQLQKHLETSK